MDGEEEGDDEVKFQVMNGFFLTQLEQ